MKRFDPKSLPYIGAVVQAILFGLAGYKYFDLGLWGAAAGVGVGAVVNLSMATASSRISDIAKSRRPLAYLSLILLFCISPAVIVTSLGWSLATLCWSVSVDLSIMLTGSTFGKSLIATEQPVTSGAQPKTKRTKPAEKLAKPAKPAYYCEVAGCERSEATPGAKPFDTQAALNAHQRKHKQQTAIAGYIATFEPVAKNETR